MQTPNPKLTVTVIGAASTTFGPKVLRDILNFEAVGGCTFNFVDTNAERLEVYDRLARRVNTQLKMPVTVHSSPERRDLLAGSDYVILSVDTGHYNTWEQDFTLPNAHGYQQVLGELGGPGGLFHALRQVPLHLEIARDIKELCPEAVVMVASNPLNRVCLALERHANLRQVVGLCHGVEMALYLFLNRVLDIDGDDLQALAAGTNHLTWLLELRRKSTGEDLYPFMRERLSELSSGEEGLSRKLLDVYGYLPATLDSHAGEYIPFAHEFARGGIDFDEHRKQEHQRWDYLKRLADDEAEWDKYEAHYGSQEGLSEELRLDPFFSERNWADTLAFPILAANISNERTWLPAVNLVNQGTISNLPADVFVEAPATVDSTGIHLQHVGPLPKPLAAFNRRDIDQTELIVEAAVTGYRGDILKAMLLDPTVQSVQAAETTLDAMLKAHAQYLPQML